MRRRVEPSDACCGCSEYIDAPRENGMIEPDAVSTCQRAPTRRSPAARSSRMKTRPGGMAVSMSDRCLDICGRPVKGCLYKVSLYTACSENSIHVSVNEPVSANDQNFLMTNPAVGGTASVRWVSGWLHVGATKSGSGELIVCRLGTHGEGVRLLVVWVLDVKDFRQREVKGVNGTNAVEQR